MAKPIALAADHGGFELKEAVKAHLDELGLEYIDFGTHSTASVDYPDMALPACDDILQPQLVQVSLVGFLQFKTAMVGGKRNGFCHEKFQSFPFSVSLFRAAASAARRSARSRSAWLRR